MALGNPDAVGGGGRVLHLLAALADLPGHQHRLPLRQRVIKLFNTRVAFQHPSSGNNGQKTV